MTWRELKELAEKEGVCDDTIVDFCINNTDDVDDLTSDLCDGVWEVV